MIQSVKNNNKKIKKFYALKNIVIQKKLIILINFKNNKNKNSNYKH